MASIKDVAKLANVSISTVSNILNNKNNMSMEVYNRVIKAIDELNYNPNLLARSLKTNKTKFIGLVLPSVNGFYNQILQGVLKIASAKEYHILLKTTNNIREVEEGVIRELVSLDVKGILIVTCNESNEKRFNDIIAKKIPLVFLERYMPGQDFTSVRFDNTNIIKNTVDGILKKNIDDKGNNDFSITLLMGPQDLSSEKDCRKGFLSACEIFNGMCGKKVLQVHLNQEHAFKDIIDHFTKDPEIADVFIVTNEEIAAALMEVLGIFGKVSEVYYLAGHDWCNYKPNERMHRIDRNAFEMGTESTRILLRYIKNPLIFENRQHVIRQEEAIKENVDISLGKPAGKSIHMLMLDGPASDALIKLLPDFCKHSGIRVDYQKCGYTELFNKLKENGKDDGQFDVFMVDFPWLNGLVESGRLLELDGYIEEDDDRYFDGFIDTIREVFVDAYSKKYCVPFMAASQALFYRKDLFEDNHIKWAYYKEFGIELRPPRNWNEFNLVAKYFTRKYNSNSPTEYGTCIVGLQPTGILEEYFPRQWSYNGKIQSANGEFVINSFENIKALNNLCETYDYSPPKSANYWIEEQINELVMGKAACINTFATHFSGIYSHEQNVFDMVRFVNIPGNAGVLGGWVLGVNAGSRNPFESYKLIKWACSSRMAAYNMLLGGFVPKNNVTNDFGLLTMYPWFENVPRHLSNGRKRQIIKNKNGDPLDNFIIEKILSEGVNAALHKKQTAEEALNAVKEKYEEIFMI